jgi:hypothetical protein
MSIPPNKPFDPVSNGYDLINGIGATGPNGRVVLTDPNCNLQPQTSTVKKVINYILSFFR